MSDFSVTFLGTNSALCAHGRHPSAQIIQFKKHRFLVDCGEGTQFQMQRYHGKTKGLNHIFISHLHGDHYYGLFGLLNTFHLQQRTKDLHIYAPAPLLDQLKVVLGERFYRLSFSLNIHATQDDGVHKIVDLKHLAVYSFPLNHRIPTTGFLFKEKEGARHIRPEQLAKYGIPNQAIPSIREGNDWEHPNGTLIANSELTLPPSMPRSYAYASDTAYQPELASVLKDVDVLYHEATFLHSFLERAVETGHSTAKQAGEMAARCRAGKLFLGHFSSRFINLKPFLEEAQSAFVHSAISEEGQTISIERREP